MSTRSTTTTTNSTTAAEAIARLDKNKWAVTSPHDRLGLLQQVQLNLYAARHELSAAEAAMKNGQMDGDEAMYNNDITKLTTVIPMANNIVGAIALYESIVSGGSSKSLLEPVSVTRVAGTDQELYDIAIAPRTMKETIFYGFRRDRLRVRGPPQRVGPMDKPVKVVAVLGAGNYSSAVEIIKAIFFDNCVVVHKPHPLNQELDKIWTVILSPLVKAGCLSFCAADQGPSMTVDARVDTIYFTGGATTAENIMKSTKIPLVCEAGGVNPVMIVPGDRSWTTSELTHHALQIVSMSKANGGHVCARPQLIVTCKNWSQREAFLEQVKIAIQETSFAVGSYYPNTASVMEKFQKEYPQAERLCPENGAFKHADVLLVTGDSEGGYGSQHEAFCQVLVEVPLDTAPTASEFLPYATDYCNKKVNGSLCATIILDEKTRKNHKDALDTCITDLEFGSIGINLLSTHSFFSEYLAWGEYKFLGNGGRDFGNLLGYVNVEKNIIDDEFVSPAQLKLANKGAIASTVSALADYAVWNSWYNLVKFLIIAIKGTLKGKDW